MPPVDNPLRSPPDPLEHLIISRLSSRGIRYTAARRQVAEALRAADGPRTAGELDDVLAPKVPLSSLYRSLAVLEEAEVVAREHDAEGVARYELSEWLTGHHHHQVCLSCGGVRDVAIDPTAEEYLDQFLRGAGTGDGFQVTGHRIDLEGTCASCSIQ